MLLAIAKLIRIEKSIFNSLSILFPILYFTQNVSLSLKYSIPVFFILTTGFIINDINDLEKDKINNSNRVLPKKDISINKAIILYYFFLAAALLAVKLLIPLNHVFIFLLYLVLMINYDYLIIAYPYLKNLYVAMVASIHLTILYLIIPINIFILIGLLINVLCREIYMDIRDIRGDGSTFAKVTGVKKTGKVILWLQVLLLVILSVVLYQDFSIVHCIAYILILITFIFNALIWFRYDVLKLKFSTATFVVKSKLMFPILGKYR
jgi:4-hydroxybenzoate polyprenyltransferase